MRVLTAGAISLFLNITGAIAPMAPVLNTPLRMKEFSLPSGLVKPEILGKAKFTYESS